LEIIVGTAGHIDHGKTALVKALTGVDADRLPEEKRRGITIDLGFAELDLGDVSIGFVDVPGHEKFVKNMLAGAHGIDLVALVIAADEGVMPQTREHFDICRLLETKSGLVILTKADLADEEMLELVKLEARELVKDSFLEKAPLVSVSAKTGAGISELKEILHQAAREIPQRKNENVMRLPIDRVFSVKGFGTVVTGTLVAGEISTGDELELLPAQKKVRVRNLQVHGKAVEKAAAGNRTAVNLGGIDTSEIERGMVLTPTGALRPAQSVDAEIEVLPGAVRSLRSRQRVRVHLGTSEVLGRLQIVGEKNEIAPGETGFAQVRLEAPAVAIPGERFVIRSYSPQVTVAGGKILENQTARHRRKDLPEVRKRLAEISAALKAGDKTALLKLFLHSSHDHGQTAGELQARTGWQTQVLRQTLAGAVSDGGVIDAGGVFISRESFEAISAKTAAEIEKHHRAEPLSRGLLRETLRERLFSHLPLEVFHKTLESLEERKEIVAEETRVRMISHNLELSSPDAGLRQKLLGIYQAAGLEVPVLENALAEVSAESGVSKDHARRILHLLLGSGELIRVTPEFLFHRDELRGITEKIRGHAAKTPDRLIDVGSFKDIAGVSRKYAIPLLEYFDREKITRRVGDKRAVL